MTHRISKAEAIQKYEREKEIQQLLKDGKPYKSDRFKRRIEKRETKQKTFIEKLKLRGGLFKPKEKGVENGKEKPEAPISRRKQR